MIGFVGLKFKILVTVICLICLGKGSDKKVEIPNPFSQLGEANQAFALDVIRLTAKENPNKNVIVSPWNIGQAYSMLLLGLRGDTFQEVSETLKYKSYLGDDLLNADNQGPLQSFISREKGKLMDMPKVHLKVVNNIYPDIKFHVEKDYLKNVKKYYHSGVKSLNYQDPLKAVNVINEDVAKATENLIPKLLPEGSVRKETQIVLTSAINLKADWDNPFGPSLTNEQNFKRDDGRIDKVKMMYKPQGEKLYGTTSFKEIEDIPASESQNIKIEILRLNYKNPKLGMYFVLPEQKGLPTLLKFLNIRTLKSLMIAVKKQHADVSIPKFKHDFNLNLKQLSQNLGIRLIFLQNGNFSGIIGVNATQNIMVSDVFHKANLQIDEKGTEASAATGIVAIPSSLPLNSFVANRPFLYFIYDDVTQQILFIGTFVKGGE